MFVLQLIKNILIISSVLHKGIHNKSLLRINEVLKNLVIVLTCLVENC